MTQRSPLRSLLFFVAAGSLLVPACAPTAVGDDDSAQSAALLSGSDVWSADGRPRWFYRNGTEVPTLFFGTWSEPLLVAGHTYELSFSVDNIKGTVGLFAGDDAVVRITTPGAVVHRFTVPTNGNRRLAFQGQALDGTGRVAIGVSGISLVEGSTTAPPPKAHAPGHYISFAMPKNLKTEVMDLLDDPTQGTPSQRSDAAAVKAALTAPGVRGVWIPNDWAELEPSEGVYDFSAIDDNLAVAKRLGIRLIVAFSDRSFDATDPMPKDLPAGDSILFDSTRSSSLSGYVAKRWDPYVVNRQARLYVKIGNTYDKDASFEGLASSETALGKFDHAAHDYTVGAYTDGIVSLFSQAKPAFVQSRLFWYVNFMDGGQTNDLATDSRTDVLDAIAGGPIVIGGPDVTPDDPGHVSSASPFYIYARQQQPNVTKSCHAQFNDQRHLKDNSARIAYQKQHGRYMGDVLRTTTGAKVDLHPANELGHYWTPAEIFQYATENFGCDYMLWHYKPWTGPTDDFGHAQYTTRDVLPVIASHPSF